MVTDIDGWKGGIGLSSAVYELADPYQRKKYQNATSPNASASMKLIMYRELFDKIESGTLEAYGFKIEPEACDFPVRLSELYFSERPNLTECDDDVVAAFRHRYEQVRVRKPIGEVTDSPPPPSIDSGSPKGRYSTYSAARKALREIYRENPSEIRKSAARLLEKFNEVFPRYAAEHGLQDAKLTGRTLQKHLKEFRKELEENGNNLNIPFKSID